MKSRIIDSVPILLPRAQFLDISSLNVVAACIGGFTVVFCVISYFLKEGLFISEPLPAVIFGLIFREAGWINPNPTNEGTQSLDFARFVLGVQLMIVGVQLPAKYLYHAWQSICVLLVGVMGFMWIASSVIIFLVVPGIKFLEALILAACITPTDPVLSNSIVSGPFAEKYVAIKLRRIIIAEAGANDGFGYPFLFLALAIYRFSGTEIARQWLLHTILYQIVLSVVYGAVVGYIGQELLMFANKR